MMKNSLFLCLFIAGLGAGFAQSPTDIYVADKVVVQRCVLNKVSPRAIAVGHPGGFNYAFDPVQGQPVFAWFGGFLDYKGMVSGRGGGACQPLGVQRPFGVSAAPFRVGEAGAAPEVMRFKGYLRDGLSGAPTFQYEVDGVQVAQQFHSPAEDQLEIVLSFAQETTDPTFYCIDSIAHASVQLSAGLQWKSPGVVAIPVGVKQAVLTIQLQPTDQVFKRKVLKLSGAELFANYCAACHSLDGTKLIGPTFKGLHGRREVIVRGGKEETITVDKAYLRESILKPQAALVKGYELIPMANFSAVLSDEQLHLLVTYLEQL